MKIELHFTEQEAEKIISKGNKIFDGDPCQPMDCDWATDCAYCPLNDLTNEMKVDYIKTHIIKEGA